MSFNYNFSHLLGAGFFTILVNGAGCAYAANHNPCDVVCTQNLVAQASTILTSADWEAVCQSGNINTSAGCYGDVGSSAFSKINSALGGLLDSNGLAGSGANTVWLRQIGNGTTCATTNEDFHIYNAEQTSADWLVGAFTVQGLNYIWQDGIMGYGGISFDGNGPNLGLILSGVTAGTHTAPADGDTFSFSPQGITPTMYVLVISAASSHSGQVVPFLQAPQSSFNTTNC